jgi:hypothetical protein
LTGCKSSVRLFSQQPASMLKWGVARPLGGHR